MTSARPTTDDDALSELLVGSLLALPAIEARPDVVPWYGSRMSGAGLLQELMSYVGFGDEDARLLVEAEPHLRAALPGVIDAFYVAIEAQPRARAVFEDGAQIERQKHMLGGWLRGIFVGTFDDAYYESRARIGYAHVRIGLDPALMIAAMSVVRTELHRAVDANVPPSTFPESRRAGLHRALDRICDVDSAIMLETYRDDYAVRIRGAEKLAALGQIAGTIGHELRNPLAVMDTSLHLLRSRLPDDPKITRHLDRLVAQVVLCTDIVRDLMDLARDRAPHRASTRVADVLADALSGLPGSSAIRARVLPDAAVQCQVDPLQLRQLLVNLVSNAVQATPSGPAGVSVTMRYDGRELVVVVEDDGPGIPDEIRPRLFEPLFTTRMRGVGFGLALCRRIAEQHGGHVRASNRPEGGARFEATLVCEPERAP